MRLGCLLLLEHCSGSQQWTGITMGTLICSYTAHTRSKLWCAVQSDSCPSCPAFLWNWTRGATLHFLLTSMSLIVLNHCIPETPHKTCLLEKAQVSSHNPIYCESNTWMSRTDGSPAAWYLLPPDSDSVFHIAQKLVTHRSILCILCNTIHCIVHSIFC